MRLNGVFPGICDEHFGFAEYYTLEGGMDKTGAACIREASS